MTFTHASYTVAWICALPLELAAAKVFLDQVHPRLTQPESDHNVYTLGSVAGHNVVVVCLPTGVYGTTSATAAVSHLISTYQNVRFGLMVGVGGGVPKGDPDIRLGDIVVSKPTDTSSGVIQYDYGKTLQSGRFHRTGSLNKPPSLLLKVIAQMDSDYMLGKASLSNILASSLQKDKVRKQFPRPPKDQLFQPLYDHVNNRPDCAYCDPSQQVNRPERIPEPYIHYGLIASGNQVIKDARTRDLFAQELDILCFEMEAAGIMDVIPSLVIRGICDYCDSHKHKEWQPYAAFVAAAYAKTVLMQVPLQERSGDLEKSVPGKRHWMVPFRQNPGFVGREGEITKVEELFGKVNGPFKVALCGLGGVGKTQIALELTYRMRERDPTCSVFWIPCTSNASIEQAFMGIAQTIGLQDVKPSDVKERVKVYLSQASGRKWLLIFDNADDMDMWVGECASATELANILAPSEQGHILFTTRNRKLAVRLTSPFVIDVSEPDTETGVKILEEGLQKKELLDNRDKTIALLKQLTFLPLAISQAAAYINSNNIKLSDYTALLKEQESDVVELLSEDFGDDGRYQDIQNPKKVDAVGLLKAFSFVAEEAKDHALSLHRLVHLSTRNWLRREQQFSLQIQKTANHLKQVFPGNEHRNQKLWREYLPHALSLAGESDFQREREEYTRLLQNVGRCLRTDGRYSEAAVLFKDMTKVRRRKLGDDDAVSLMADLASTYSDQGRWEEAKELKVQVLEISKRVLEIRKRVLGPEHPCTLTSMANLAFTLYSQERVYEAVVLMEKCVRLQVRSLGPSHPHTKNSARSLKRWKEMAESSTDSLEAPRGTVAPQL
ncbi:purine and uridine phosphorylase [Aspergillus lucknowensis]|uniref:Purine and uridine phosphorylase n=1 Tax=Aspergillus lucknowensis TaxID=176173 RepID=A0ABR4L5S1_9EURO